VRFVLRNADFGLRNENQELQNVRTTESRTAEGPKIRSRTMDWV
jgi:hypothetical protein